LQLTVTRFGGHCGFLERFTGPSWVERRIVAELDAEHEAGEMGTVLTSA
jgi:predicted alpha/beta-fold hydrolase